MNKSIKRLLWFLIQQAENAATERKFCILMTQRVLPLLRKIYPEVCVEYPCPSEDSDFEERERYNRVLYFGGDFDYWQTQQFSLLQLRMASAYKAGSKLDEPKILYQCLYMFEKMWNKEFRDFLRKKILYGAHFKYKTSQHQNKTRRSLSRADEMRDLQIINLRMEQHEINALKGKTQIVVDGMIFKTRGQLPQQVRIEFDKLFFGDDCLVLCASVDPSSIVAPKGNLWYTKQKLLDYIRAIVCADSEFVLGDQQIQIDPLSIELATDETEEGIQPKALYLLVDWGHGIIERLILWHNDKTSVDYLSYLLEYLLQQGDAISSAKKPEDYKNFGKYLKRLGLELVLQQIFCITRKTRYPKVGRSKIFIRELSLSDKAELFELLPSLPFHDWVDDLEDIEIQKDRGMELLFHIPESTIAIKS